jgi:hypothetical protein
VIAHYLTKLIKKTDSEGVAVYVSDRGLTLTRLEFDVRED